MSKDMKKYYIYGHPKGSSKEPSVIGRATATTATAAKNKYKNGLGMTLVKKISDFTIDYASEHD